jgi:ABC-type Mn2+/Zn2+ transport system ATPase subunit
VSWLLRCENLALGFGPDTLLSGVHLEIHPGQFWYVVGPNGHGKTTLLRTLLGLLPARQGLLLRDEARAGPARTGYVPQRIGIPPHVRTTVSEFVAGGFAGLGWPRAKCAEALRLALEQAGLSGLAGRELHTLSGGLRQRALIGRALVRQPAWLAVDEPAASLDPAIGAAVLEVLQSVRAHSGTAVVCVSHDLAQARSVATHAALVACGRVQSGPAAAILTDDRLAEAFGFSRPVFPPPLGAA